MISTLLVALFQALPVYAVQRCVYSTPTVHKEFYCNTTQKCCDSQCCDELLKWYYWLPLVLGVVLFVTLALLCWRWKKQNRRSLMENRTTITPIRPIYPSIPPPQSQSVDNLPAPYGLPRLPYSVSNYSGYPPSSMPPPDFSTSELSDDSPPSYEQLYGMSDTSATSISQIVEQNHTTSTANQNQTHQDARLLENNTLNVPNNVPLDESFSSNYSQGSSMTTATWASNRNNQLRVTREATNNGQTILVLTTEQTSSSNTNRSNRSNNLMKF